MMKQIEMSNNQTSLFSMTETNNKLLRTFINILFVLGLITITCITYHYSSKDIILKIAYGGASPINYVAEKQKPENFEKNWEAAGVGKMDYTITMKVFYWLDRYFSISPTKTIYPFMFIQTLLFVLSVAFLAQTLFNNKIITFISVTVVLLSHLAGLDLSRFGKGFGSYLSYALYYGYAISFSLFAIGFFLRKKAIPCFVFLALGIYCHVTIGLFALAFVGFYVLYRPKLILEKSFIIGIFIFSVLIFPYIFSIFSNAAITSGGIPADQWIKSTKMFSYHWYPLTMKMFTKNARNEFYPFLLLCFFFFVALRYQDIKSERTIKLITGCVGCLVISIIGVIVSSDICPIPFLIKISLQRSTGFITFFSVLFITYYLIKKIETGNIFVTPIAFYSLYTLIFSLSVTSILIPLSLLLFFDIRDGHLGCLKISSKPFSKIGIPKIMNYDAVKRLLPIMFMLMSVLTVLYIKRDDYYGWHNGYAEIASDYLDVQLWAKNNTPPDALFMPDPTHFYGWRDFSERSSFGNFREWGYTSIAYNPDYKVYQEGLKRIREFGVDIEKITEEDIENYEGFPYSETLREQIRNIYYNMNDDRRLKFAKRYGIDYFVMEKSKIMTSSAMSVAYKNDYYIVYKP